MIHELILFLLCLTVLADYKVVFDIQIDEQKSGTFIIEIYEDWAPLGAARFHELVADKYFDGARFFRVLNNFMAQFGIAGDPKMTAKWRKPIKDDPFIKSNAPGTLTFATSGKNTRSAQLFINFVNNKYLDKDFAPIGKITKGMDIVNQIYKGYGEKPDQGRLNNQGNAYVVKAFPKLSWIKTARFFEEKATQAAAATVEKGAVKSKTGKSAVVAELMEKKITNKVNKKNPLKLVKLNANNKTGMQYIYYLLGLAALLGLVCYYVRVSKKEGKHR